VSDALTKAIAGKLADDPRDLRRQLVTMYLVGVLEILPDPQIGRKDGQQLAWFWNLRIVRRNVIPLGESNHPHRQHKGADKHSVHYETSRDILADAAKQPQSRCLLKFWRFQGFSVSIVVVVAVMSDPSVRSVSTTPPQMTEHENRPTPANQPNPLRRLLGRWLRDVLISLGVSIFFIVFLYQPVKVEGTSMMPTLEDQERVFINKFVYRLEAIQRGDVVVFRYPRDTSKSYIKRVIAVPGDRVRIDNGLVYVNGRQVAEEYVPPMYEDVRSYAEIMVPQHSYFVLGDHRNLSNDSRDFGPVDESYIYGKAVFGYWPFGRLGKLQ